MSVEKAGAVESQAAGVKMGCNMDHVMEAPFSMAVFECVGADGKVRWRETYHNAVVNEGKKDLLNNYFGRTGPAAYNTWYMGLHSGTTTSTNQSFSTLSQSEVSAYYTAAGTSTWRAQVTFASNNAQASQSVSAAYIFTHAGTQTVQGAFIAGSNMSATNATNGLLYSVGLFGASRAVLSNDTLNVSVTISFA